MSLYKVSILTVHLIMQIAIHIASIEERIRIGYLEDDCDMFFFLPQTYLKISNTHYSNCVMCI